MWSFDLAKGNKLSKNSKLKTKNHTMANWFDCKVKYKKTMEDGKIKPVTDEYLVDALTFTEAEKRFIEEITPFMMGEFEVTDIKRYRVSELFESQDAAADKWYRAKLVFITLDEKTAVEKRTATLVLVKATDINNALATVLKGMEGTLGDYAITAIQETNILDVVRYQVEEKKA